MSKKQNNNETKRSVDDLNSIFIQNEKRNPSLYVDVPYVDEINIIPREDTSKNGYGFRLKKKDELTKAQTNNKSLMIDFEIDVLLNRSRNALINSVKNFNKSVALKAAIKNS
tara:strand:+ start:138 stop:473 length:336 start_codon:yes stop_codon:yes gene_type:complete